MDRISTTTDGILIAMGKIAEWLQYRKEALRRGFYKKRAGYVLLINVSILVLGGALLVFFLERGRNPNIHSYFDAFYMIIITIATVGYGDITPVTAGGRVTVILVLVVGIGTLSAFVTLMATRRAEGVRRRYSGLQEKLKSRGHLVVCGWNISGQYVLSRLKEELQRKPMEVVLLCDLQEDPIDDDFTYFFRGDPTSVEALELVNIAEAKSAILLADDSKGGSEGDIDARTVLTAMNIKQMNADIQITAEALRPENIHHMKLAGVREILDVTSILGNLMARSALHYGLISTVSDLVTREAGTRTYYIPANKEATGKTRAEVESDLQAEYGAQLVAITWQNGLRPSDADYRIQEGDRLIVLAQKKPSGATE
jgi:voltage-gated potassium channel